MVVVVYEMDALFCSKHSLMSDLLQFIGEEDDCRHLASGRHGCLDSEGWGQAPIETEQ